MQYKSNINELNALLIKSAGIADILGGLKDSVKKYVLGNIDTSSKGALLKSVINLLAPSMMFRVSPFLGILATAASMYDINITDIWDSIYSMIKPTIEAGEQVDPGQINDAAQMFITASYNKGQIIKNSQRFFGGSRYRPRGGHYLFPPKRMSALERAFGFLGERKVKNIVIGFIAWFIKTILASAGLLAGAGAIKDVLTDEESPKYERTEPDTVYVKDQKGQQKQVSRPPGMKLPPPPTINLKRSGKGETIHKNDENSMWLIPVKNDVKTTLSLWAQAIYPELAGREDLIYASNHFNKIANMLEAYRSPTSPYLVMPQGTNRIIDVVNLFVPEVEQKLGAVHE